MEEVATAPWWAFVIIVVFFGGIIGKLIYNRMNRPATSGTGGGGRSPKPPIDQH